MDPAAINRVFHLPKTSFPEEKGKKPKPSSSPGLVQRIQHIFAHFLDMLASIRFSPRREEQPSARDPGMDRMGTAQSDWAGRMDTAQSEQDIPPGQTFVNERVMINQIQHIDTTPGSNFNVVTTCNERTPKDQLALDYFRSSDPTEAQRRAESFLRILDKKLEEDPSYQTLSKEEQHAVRDLIIFTYTQEMQLMFTGLFALEKDPQYTTTMSIGVPLSPHADSIPLDLKYEITPSTDGQPAKVVLQFSLESESEKDTTQVHFLDGKASEEYKVKSFSATMPCQIVSYEPTEPKEAGFLHQAGRKFVASIDTEAYNQLPQEQKVTCELGEGKALFDD